MGYLSHLNHVLQTLKLQHPRNHVVIWYFDHGPSVSFLPGTRWIKQERQELANGSFPASYHYESFLILEGGLKYSHPDLTSKDNVRKYLAATTEFNWETKQVSFPLNSEFTGQAWMKFLEDDGDLDRLTLPGTHSSGAVADHVHNSSLDLIPDYDVELHSKLSEMHVCHQDIIRAQLNKGVRILDLRFGDSYRLQAGPFLLYRPLEWALDDIKAFLNDNKTETVIVLIRWGGEQATIDRSQPWPQCYETKPTTPPSGYKEKIKKMIEARIDSFYTENRWPKLKEVRGKAVVVRGWDSTDNWGMGPRSIENARFTEDSSASEVADKHWDVVKAGFQAGTDNIKTVSLAATIERNPAKEKQWETPQKMAPHLQDRAAQCIESLKVHTPRIWVLANHVDQAFCLKVAKLNFKGSQDPCNVP